MSGVWKEVLVVNYDNLLRALGAGFIERFIDRWVSTTIDYTDTITMDSDLTAFRLTVRAGCVGFDPVLDDNTYEIGGEETTTKVS